MAEDSDVTPSDDDDATPAADGALHFPDVPKLELDQVIDQLVDRAQDVKRTQGRLRTLVRAIETISSDLSLESVLRTIAEVACELAGARYAALGVNGTDGRLEQFVHVGVDDATVARIGALPQGGGLLGALDDDPRPIRLEHLGKDPRSTGFPAGHPPMDSFLGVPVRVRGAVFGNLYLTDSVRGAFSREDEELVLALAFAAGTAISNARLYADSQLQERWLRASAEISAQLLAAEDGDPLQLIAERALEVSGADLTTISLLTTDARALVMEVAVGAGSDQLIGRRTAVEDTLSYPVVTEQQPLLMVSAEPYAGGDRVPAPVIDIGPAMILPLRRTAQVRGVLTILRTRGRPAFSAIDLDMAAGFANHASVALELADARNAERRVVLLEDRDRIARDLHDHVIQELFAVGLGLETTAMGLGATSAAAQRLQQGVMDLDGTIQRIRSAIFELRGPVLGGGGLRTDVLRIVADLTPALGFPPTVAFTGPVDSAVDADLLHDVCAVTREALTNVVKHARAGSVDLEVTVANGVLTVEVTDDGVGVGDATRSSGVGNLRARATRRGGRFTLGPGVRTGTRATWYVLLDR